MKKNIANKWIKALTSNKYKQGRNVLCHQGANKQYKYCCLGVLCDLYTKDSDIAKNPKKQLEVEKEKFQLVANKKAVNVLLYNDTMEILPNEVIKWAGMKSSDGEVFNSKLDESITLAEMNDTGSSFEEISEVIKKNYKHL
jgi:hypothetical protein